MTPAHKVKDLLREFARTLDASASARAVGIPERTARDIIARHERTAALRRGHARACERAIREGRKALREELRTNSATIATLLERDRGQQAAAAAAAAADKPTP